jgi:flagellar basal-body rod protein FlgF
MDSLTTAAASGMRSRLEALDLLANNIANASAPGFKADHEFYGQYLSAEASSQAGTVTTLPVVERNWTDFSQGSLVATGNPLDLALSGRGFLTAKSPSGAVFTRAGALHLSPQGELQTQDGYPILDSNGKAIPADASKPVEITPDGTVRQDGQDLARIAVVDFPDLSALNKQGHAYFSSNAQPVPSSALIEQGKIESANSQPAESAVRLVGVMRQFDMLQRAMSIGTDMNKRALDEVARIAS